MGSGKKNHTFDHIIDISDKSAGHHAVWQLISHTSGRYELESSMKQSDLLQNWDTIFEKQNWNIFGNFSLLKRLIFANFSYTFKYNS